MTEHTTDQLGWTSELLTALGQDGGWLVQEEVDRIRNELGTSLRNKGTPRRCSADPPSWASRPP